MVCLDNGWANHGAPSPHESSVSVCLPAIGNFDHKEKTEMTVVNGWECFSLQHFINIQILAVVWFAPKVC